MNTARSQADQRRLAEQFRQLNLAGRLLLPNAWDAASARIFESAGFPAVATTSAGIAHSRGLRDAEHIDRDTMMGEVARIAAAVRCPVSADIEAGYGPSASDVGASVEAVLHAGAVGINLEDATHAGSPQPLFGIAEQRTRIAAARAAGERAGIPVVINARTDTFLANVAPDLEARVAETIERGNAYLQAGADVVFVPGPTQLALIQRIAQAIRGPVNFMVGPGAPSAAELFAAGAKRLSIGPSAMLATLGLVREIATEMRERGTWDAMGRHSCSFSEAEALFDR